MDQSCLSGGGVESPQFVDRADFLYIFSSHKNNEKSAKIDDDLEHLKDREKYLTHASELFTVFKEN